MARRRSSLSTCQGAAGRVFAHKTGANRLFISAFFLYRFVSFVYLQKRGGEVLRNLKPVGKTREENEAAGVPMYKGLTVA
jgi:hypothetical protein